jgi:sterol desaturase/sphingolipid hydroxylase (fatty acid hydroxylase superfamily)
VLPASLIARLGELGRGPYLLVAVVALIALEGIVARLARRKVDLPEEAASYGVGIGYFAINVVAKNVLFLGAYVAVYERARLFSWSIHSPWAWAAFLLLGDFVYYWTHRAEHEIRLFWAAHETHHSARTYTFGTAVRMPWGEVLYLPIVGFWAPLLGFPPEMYPVVGAFNLLCGLLQHTELVKTLGPLEWVFATPSHHRVHHGSDLEYLDCNYGARLILWDRLFGTFRAETKTPTYGLTTNLDTRNPLRIATHGYTALLHDLRRAPRWSDRLRYLFLPPGYRHDGPDESARARRARQAASHTPAQAPRV